MPAKFIDYLGQLPQALGVVGQVYGQRFPSEEVEALWHMVPGHFSVEWVTATSEFVIKDIVRYQWKHRSTPVGIRTIKATECFDYDLWVKTFQDLWNEGHPDIVAAQNIDPDRAP